MSASAEQGNRIQIRSRLFGAGNEGDASLVVMLAQVRVEPFAATMALRALQPVTSLGDTGLESLSLHAYALAWAALWVNSTANSTARQTGIVWVAASDLIDPLGVLTSYARSFIGARIRQGALPSPPGGRRQGKTRNYFRAALGGGHSAAGRRPRPKCPPGAALGGFARDRAGHKHRGDPDAGMAVANSSSRGQR